MGIERGERMIDTDKYEGHTPPHWIWIDWIKLPATLKDVDKKLMQDAPLLLAEVKRLSEGHHQAIH